MKCYKPNFFENQSERLAITKPANTCNDPKGNKKFQALNNRYTANLRNLNQYVVF